MAGDNDGGDNIDIIMGQRRDVRVVRLRREEAAARRGGARDRADTGDEICAILGEDTRESTCNVNGRKNKL